MILTDKLQNKLHTQIPLTKYMNIEIKKYSTLQLTTTAPLQININDKGTAFAGSLSTLVTISAWSMCWLLAQELGFKDTSIVIFKNKTNYFKPVLNNIICQTNKPSKDEIIKLKEKLLSKRSGSITIKSSIVEDNCICVDFEGLYVIKLL